MTRKLRCERLRQVRRREDNLARASRQKYLATQRLEEHHEHVLESQAQLEAKRALLARLLEERATCEAMCGEARRAAAERSREQELEAAQRQQLSAQRRELGVQRGLEALRRSRELQRAELLEFRAQLDRSRQVRECEDLRAQEAAEKGRMVVKAGAAASLAVALDAYEVAKTAPKRIPRVNSSGNVDYSKTYYHVLRHGPGLDEPDVKAELDRALSPPPTLTADQLRRAAARGHAAEAEIAAQRFDADVQRRLAEEETRNRAGKVQRAASAGAPRVGRLPPHWAWGLPGEASARFAEAEAEKLLVSVPHAGAPIATSVVGLDEWRSGTPHTRASRRGLGDPEASSAHSVCACAVPAVGRLRAGRARVSGTPEAQNVLLADSAVITEDPWVEAKDAMIAVSEQSFETLSSLSEPDQHTKSTAVCDRCSPEVGVVSSGLPSSSSGPGSPPLHGDSAFDARAADIDSLAVAPQLSEFAPASSSASIATGPTTSPAVVTSAAPEIVSPAFGDAVDLCMSGNASANRRSTYAEDFDCVCIDSQDWATARSGVISIADVAAVHTPSGNSPQPSADRLDGLLSEAERLLQETAAVAAPLIGGIGEELGWDALDTPATCMASSRISAQENGGGLGAVPPPSSTEHLVARRRGGGDLAAQLEAICRELDHAVGEPGESGLTER